MNNCFIFPALRLISQLIAECRLCTCFIKGIALNERVRVGLGLMDLELPRDLIGTVPIYMKWAHHNMFDWL